MEQKMYERQISKLSMAFRVVDEHQIDRHFNAKNQEELYEFEPKTSAPITINLPKVFVWFIWLPLFVCFIMNIFLTE